MFWELRDKYIQEKLNNISKIPEVLFSSCYGSETVIL